TPGSTNCSSPRPPGRRATATSTAPANQGQTTFSRRHRLLRLVKHCFTIAPWSRPSPKSAIRRASSSTLPCWTSPDFAPATRSRCADVVEIAAAYLFYLCRNHAFNDGNKRAAMASAIVFLRLNGIEPAPDSDAWKELVLDVAASKLDREQTTARLHRLVAARRARKKKR